MGFFYSSEVKRNHLLQYCKIWTPASFLKTATICANSVIFNYKSFTFLFILLFKTVQIHTITNSSFSALRSSLPKGLVLTQRHLHFFLVFQSALDKTCN